MPKLLVSFVFIAVFAILLCGPVLYVALRLRRRGDAMALRPLRAVWLVQLVLAAGLMMAADLADVAPLQSWLVGILLGVSLAGAATFWTWRRMVRWRAR